MKIDENYYLNLKQGIENKTILSPFNEANDCDSRALAAAVINAEYFKMGRFCQCKGEHDQAYYRHHDGRHGWICCNCCGITQTG